MDFEESQIRVSCKISLSKNIDHKFSIFCHNTFQRTNELQINIMIVSLIGNMQVHLKQSFIYI